MTPAELDAEVAHDRCIEAWENPLAYGARPAGLCTLGEIMKTFPAAQLQSFSWLMGKFGFPVRRDLDARVGGTLVLKEMDEFAGLLRKLDFDGLDPEVEWVRSSAAEITWNDYGHRLDTMRRLLHVHLCKQLVLKVERERALRAGGGGKIGDQFGPTVAAIASDAVKGEIHEALWAWAFNRSTACVFHLMRVVEAGLITLTKVARVRVTKSKPLWSDYLKAIDKRLHPPQPMRGMRQSKCRPLSRADSEFLSEVHLHIRNISEAWRNPVVHEIARSYTPEQAETILDDVERLMVKIATHPKALRI